MCASLNKFITKVAKTLTLLCYNTIQQSLFVLFRNIVLIVQNNDGKYRDLVSY